MHNKIIILYGPPNAGKGTQGKFLKMNYPHYFHLDFGTELRSFVQRHIGNYNEEKDIINPDSHKQDILVAQKVKQKLRNLEAVDIEDIKYVIEETIVQNWHKGMIIEGPGRSQLEADWLSSFFAGIIKDIKEKNTEIHGHPSIGQLDNLEVLIFHLHISISEAIQRATTRYYVPGIDNSFSNYQEAKLLCKQDQEPYKRIEDSQVDSIVKRYTELYMDIFAKILSIYQKKCHAKLFIIDGSQDVNTVSRNILEILREF